MEIKSFKDLPPGQQLDVAEQVQQYTNGQLGEKPQMVPINMAEVYQKQTGFVALCDDEFAGFIGANGPNLWHGASMPEVGSLWVPKTFRHQGAGHELIRTITSELTVRGDLPYAFCNPLSAPIFKSIGYTAAACVQLPSGAFELCQKCPSKPSVGCCDKPMVYKGGII